jgi:synaptobrevin family protein YKT6
MRIVSAQIFCTYNEEPIKLGGVFELDFVSFLQRGTIKEFINFNSRLVIKKIGTEQPSEISFEGTDRFVCYAMKNSDNLGLVIICDNEYPKRVATDLVYRTMQELNSFIYQNKLNVKSYQKDTDIKFPYINTIIKEWQKPEEKDNLMKLQGELNSVQEIMKKNLNELLNREENLDKLMEKSNDLSGASLQFYKQAKKTNSCCNF